MASTDLFQVKNGFVDLKTGQFYENNQLDTQLNTKLDINKINLIEWKGIEYPTDFIDNYISQLVDPNDIQQLQKILGCFISNNKEMIYLQIYGNGCNGKSKFIYLITEILDNRYEYIQDSILTTNKPCTLIISDKTRVLITEVDNSSKIKIGRIKELLSHDSIIITKHQLYKPKEQQISNISKIIVHTHTPLVSDDNGFNIRLKTIQFTNNFTPDATFPDTLMDKLDEFLVWLVKGSIMYYNDQTL